MPKYLLCLLTLSSICFADHAPDPILDLSFAKESAEKGVVVFTGPVARKAFQNMTQAEQWQSSFTFANQMLPRFNKVGRHLSCKKEPWIDLETNRPVIKNEQYIWTTACTLRFSKLDQGILQEQPQEVEVKQLEWKQTVMNDIEGKGRLTFAPGPSLGLWKELSGFEVLEQEHILLNRKHIVKDKILGDFMRCSRKRDPHNPHLYRQVEWCHIEWKDRKSGEFRKLR